MSGEHERDSEHPLLSDETDVEEAQKHAAPVGDGEPTGQTGSAEEQYAGAGTSADAEPELHRKLDPESSDDGDREDS